jgi:hypothetical protein
VLSTPSPVRAQGLIGGVGGDDAADWLRYLVATKSRAPSQTSRSQLRALILSNPLGASSHTDLPESHQHYRRGNRRKTANAPNPPASRDVVAGSGMVTTLTDASKQS